jgi:hypothetical protein
MFGGLTDIITIFNYPLNPACLNLAISIERKYNSFMSDKSLSSFALLSAAEVLSSLNSTSTGLTKNEVDNGLRTYGLNALNTTNKKSFNI